MRVKVMVKLHADTVRNPKAREFCCLWSSWVALLEVLQTCLETGT